MTEPIVIKEYSSEKINNCDLDKLHKYLKCKNITSALKVTPSGVETNSWVGVIKYKKLHLEILPKLICNQEDDYEQILNNLLFMLSFTKKLDIKTNNTAKLSTSKNPFIEVLIREFAQSLFDNLKRLTPKKYIREEENLNYLKGKLKFSENIRYNSANQAKFYCEYDEFSENNILNQLFLFVATCLYAISKDSYNKKTLRFIINYYTDVKLVKFDRFKVAKIKLTRSQELFKKSFNLAKMFIENTSVDLSKNKVENITLIWDMNKLFEEFIFEIMKKCETELYCTLSAQRGRKLLVGDNCKKRNTFVDIMIEKNIKKEDNEKNKEKEKIVLDTKYKKFLNTNDFSNADIFQVSTYCLLHNAHHAILLYPQWGKEPLMSHYYLNTDSGKYRIYFKTVNLKYNDLKKELGKIKTEIIELFNFPK